MGRFYRYNGVMGMFSTSCKWVARAAAVAIGTVVAPFVMAQDGTTAYQFLDVTPSSHVYALGGHNITLIDDDINLVEQNPALLGAEFDKQAGINYMRYIGGTNFMGVRYGQGIGTRGSIAGGIQHYGYGSFIGADATGVKTGTFNASDLCFSVTYSHDVTDRLRGGATLKYIHSSYADYNSGAIAVDLGLSYFNEEKDLSLGLVVKNLGGQVKKFNETKDKVPWDIQIGITKGLGNTPFRLSLTAYNLHRWKLPYYVPEDANNTSSDLIKKENVGSNLLRHFVFGVDVNPSERFYISLGYNDQTRTYMSTYKRNFLSGFSVGGGLRVKALGFGAAFAQPHSGATTFMFNLTASIGEFLK